MLYYMFNKPQGCVTARTDEIHRTVMDYFPKELAQRLHPVGRLDKDTCGLLILTDDGDLEEFMPDDRRSRYMKNPNGPAFSAYITIYEGKKHQVKRMLEAAGCRIFYLRRDMIGALALDPALSQGEYRPLTEEELIQLKNN